MDDFKTALSISKYDATIPEKLIDLFYKFQSSTWTAFYDLFPTIQGSVSTVVVELNEIYEMFGINLADKPDLLTLGVLIPLLNVVVQFAVTKTSMSSSGGAQNQTNQTMMYTMPLVSGFFATTLPAGLGLYWLAGSVFQLGQQLVINKHIHNELDKKKKK
jgi:YidC/Oxa1 family membrane protein insertase